MKTKKIISIFIIISLITVMILSFTACSPVEKGDDEYVWIGPPPDPPKVISYVYTYNYNEATENNTESSIELKPEEYRQKTLVVPIRDGFEFEGWYADWFLKTPVSDKEGNVIIGDEFFDIESNDLYAKWSKKNAPVYPILMVFVTEVDAILEATDGTRIPVKYSMSETERKICELIPPQFKLYLDAMLNGTVQFKVDAYFTTKVLGARSFTKCYTYGLGLSEPVVEYGLDALNIPELGGMEWPEINGLPSDDVIEGDGILSKYRSIITTFNMNDYDEVLHITAGSGYRKYAYMHMEVLFYSLMIQNTPFEAILDLNSEVSKKWLAGYLYFYLHEFTHSVEYYIDTIKMAQNDYHEVSKYYAFNRRDKGQSGDSGIEVIRQFLCNLVEIDGEKYGIPYSFWNS